MPGMHRLALAAAIAAILCLPGAASAETATVSKTTPQAATGIVARAESGDAAAQNLLGEMYENGNGVPRDPAKAAHWYRLAAKQGLSEAQLSLGVLYENGEGVAQSDAEAARWYAGAAEQGNLFAQLSLGIMYRE